MGLGGWCNHGDSAIGVPRKSMVETEILKFGEAEEKNQENEQRKWAEEKRKGRKWREIWILKFVAH